MILQAARHDVEYLAGSRNKLLIGPVKDAIGLPWNALR